MKGERECFRVKAGHVSVVVVSVEEKEEEK